METDCSTGVQERDRAQKILLALFETLLYLGRWKDRSRFFRDFPTTLRRCWSNSNEVSPSAFDGHFSFRSTHSVKWRSGERLNKQTLNSHRYTAFRSRIVLRFSKAKAMSSQQQLMIMESTRSFFTRLPIDPESQDMNSHMSISLSTLGASASLLMRFLYGTMN